MRAAKPNTLNQSFFHLLGNIYVGSVAPSENRNALLDAKQIRIEIAGNKVMLHGTVPTLTQREEAERVAWAAQGMCSVDNHLAIEWSKTGD